MPAATKTTKTISVEKDLLRRIEQTRGDASTSARINQLLKAGLEAERRLGLYREAEDFFKVEDERAERRAFQSAALRAISRD
jgi:hypothetical protein